MKFKDRLLQGSFVKRYKRFFVDINFKGKIITAHCPNPGSMMGLLNKGSRAWFSKTKNPKRKLQYTLQIIETKNNLVGVNTLLANKIVLESLNFKKIKSLTKYGVIQSEKKFSNNTRFDFLISNDKEKCFLEVKNVTLVRKKEIAEFPDSITSRGTKHLIELIKARKMGFQTYILYLIQRNDCKTFEVAGDIDKNYKIAFNKAIKAGVKILCYDCKISEEEVKLNHQIDII